MTSPCARRDQPAVGHRAVSAQAMPGARLAIHWKQHPLPLPPAPWDKRSGLLAPRWRHPGCSACVTPTPRPTKRNRPSGMADTATSPSPLASSCHASVGRTTIRTSPHRAPSPDSLDRRMHPSPRSSVFPFRTLRGHDNDSDVEQELASIPSKAREKLSFQLIKTIDRYEAYFAQ